MQDVLGITVISRPVIKPDRDGSRLKFVPPGDMVSKRGSEKSGHNYVDSWAINRHG